VSILPKCSTQKKIKKHYIPRSSRLSWSLDSVVWPSDSDAHKLTERSVIRTRGAHAIIASVVHSFQHGPLSELMWAQRVDRSRQSGASFALNSVHLSKRPIALWSVAGSARHKPLSEQIARLYQLRGVLSVWGYLNSGLNLMYNLKSIIIVSIVQKLYECSSRAPIIWVNKLVDQQGIVVRRKSLCYNRAQRT